jgi:hypothetical protein
MRDAQKAKYLHRSRYLGKYPWQPGVARGGGELLESYYYSCCLAKQRDYYTIYGIVRVTSNVASANIC